tara:strand:+ start:395 stop:877 length:483 start_codon:yes stop_codon:yes gene_type:complete
MPAPIPTIENYMTNGVATFQIAEADRYKVAGWLRDAWDQVYADLDAEGLSNVTFTDRTFSANPENGYEYFPGWLKDKLDDDYDDSDKDTLLVFRGSQEDNLVYVVYNGTKVIDFDVESDFNNAITLAYQDSAVRALSFYNESTTVAQNAYNTTLNGWQGQ